MKQLYICVVCSVHYTEALGNDYAIPQKHFKNNHHQCTMCEICFSKPIADSYNLHFKNHLKDYHYQIDLV